MRESTEQTLSETQRAKECIFLHCLSVICCWCTTTPSKRYAYSYIFQSNNNTEKHTHFVRVKRRETERQRPRNGECVCDVKRLTVSTWLHIIHIPTGNWTCRYLLCVLPILAHGLHSWLVNSTRNYIWKYVQNRAEENERTHKKAKNVRKTATY